MRTVKFDIHEFILEASQFELTIYPFKHFQHSSCATQVLDKEVQLRDNSFELSSSSYLEQILNKDLVLIFIQMTDTAENAPTKGSVLTFREITEANWRGVANLKLKEGQTGNLASNLWSLCEAHYAEEAWIRAIYADETLVGFLMLGLWDPEDVYLLWRFMIDARYQGLGYGKRSVEFAIAHVREHHPQAKRLQAYSSPPEGHKSDDPLKNVKPEDSPFKFYEKLGFKPAEPPVIDDDGDVELWIDL